MATSGDVFCYICDGRQLTKIAECWCPECQEGLCSECLEHHNISRYTKQHEVISVDNYKKVPPSISKFPTYCEEHNQRFQNYCPKHECLCCPLCIATDHKKCTDLKTVEDVIKTSKTSVILDRLQDSLENIKRNMKNVREDREQNLIHIEELKKSFRVNMKEFRVNIISHLDKLADKFEKELEVTAEKGKATLKGIIHEVEEKDKKIEKLSAEVVAVKHYASNLQTYLVSKNLEVRIEAEENYIKSLSEDVRLQQMTLKWKNNEKITDMMSLDSFGSVIMEATTPKVIINTEKEKHAQIISGAFEQRPKRYEDIKLTLKSKFTLRKREKRTFLTGCSISTDGKIIFTYHYSDRLILVNKDCKVDKEIPFISPFDVAFVDDITAIVSNSDGVTKLKIITKQSESIKNIKNYCFGVSTDNEQLVWCALGKGIHMQKLSGGPISVISSIDGTKWWCYVTLYRGRLYVTDPDRSSITCYRTNGKKEWEFEDTSILKWPHGIDVDNYSNVYVASTVTNSIVLISNDGKYARQILCNANDIDKPWALCFDRVRNQLLVADKTKNIACLYSL